MNDEEDEGGVRECEDEQEVERREVSNQVVKEGEEEGEEEAS